MAPSTLQPSALALVVVPAVLSTLVVAVRIGKRAVDRGLAVEDALLVIAQILIIALTYTTWISYKKSYYGYHYYDIPLGAIDRTELSKWGFANAVIYNPILGLIKASFVITLIKLYSPNRWINRALWTIFTINGLFTIAAPLICAFQCSPISKFWDKTKPGKCIDGPSYTYGTISVVLITDVLVLMMPTWILYDLQMPLKRKLVITSFLSLGLAVTGIGAYRLWVFYNLYNGNSRNPDATYSVRQGLSNVEVSLASIGACGPTIKWLLGHCIPFFAGTDSPRISKHTTSKSSTASGRPGPGGNWSDAPWRDRNRTNTVSSEDPEESELVEQERPYLVPAWKNTEYRYKARGPKPPKLPQAGADGDEKRFSMVDYIRKTTEWDVASDRRSATPKNKEVVVHEEREARPRHVV